MMRDLPSGTVTFLFSDIEGSTKLLSELGVEAYGDALAEHRRILRAAFDAHGGVEIDTQGDAFFVAFSSATGAVAAALQARDDLDGGPIRVRMGLHTGAAHLVDEGYIGHDVHKGARIAAAGHGGQVLLSKETRDRTNIGAIDLGEHRLKDFDEPVAIFQAGSDRFPPLKTISNTNLPRPASSFVGRDREVQAIAELLRTEARFLTLTGPGGSGKTRLAIEAAAELVPEYKAGVFWIGLAPVRDPKLVVETIARTLGVENRLAEHIGERELLLLIDNVEQVVDAAPELASLVEMCPNLRLMVTSRELLRVRGEVEYAVAPLSEPEAVELFSVRARTAPDETVHALCRALDNLPLAVELAAARTSVLSTEQLLERLSLRLDLLRGGRDADPRQQTLRATIEWSYGLLSAGEQQLFRRLAVFRGGCTLEAAEKVAWADLDQLQSLVDKSLVRHSEKRFWMLETIRDYAAERLVESLDAEEVRDRHANHFVTLAEEAEPNLRGRPGAWLDRLEAEHDNLRAASDQLEALGETEAALRLAAALWRFWLMRGHLAEGRRRLDDALAGDSRPTPARANALNGVAAMAVTAGDAARARLHAEAALALSGQLDDAWAAVYSRYLLGYALREEGDFATAYEILAESIQQFRGLGDEHYAMVATGNLASLCDELGDLERGRALREDNLQRARAVSDERIEAMSLFGLAEHACNDGRVQDAFLLLRDAYQIRRKLGERPEIADILATLAAALAVAGEWAAAAQVLSSSEALREEIGGAFQPWDAARFDRTLGTLRGQLDEPAFGQAWQRGRTLTPDEALALALSCGEVS